MGHPGNIGELMLPSGPVYLEIVFNVSAVWLRINSANAVLKFVLV